MRGLLLAISAYGIWGCFPLFFSLLVNVSAFEVLAHRIVWAYFFTGLVILALGRRKQLAALIAKLGKSRLSQNINQLAKAVHTGSLPVTPETEADLQKASKDIADIRLLLIEALGLKE